MTSNKKIMEVIENQEPAYASFYRNYKEIQNYHEPGSIFHRYDIIKDLDKVTEKMLENAIEHGLPQDLFQQYLEESSAWELLTKIQKETILAKFTDDVFPGMAVTDIIEKAYKNNEKFSVKQLEHIYKRLMEIDQKDSSNYLKKLFKIVTLSIVNEYNSSRISYPGDHSTIIIGEDIYIRAKNSEIYFSSSSNGTIRNTLNQIYHNSISSRQKLETILQIMDLCNVIDFQSAIRYIKFKNDFVFDMQNQEITEYKNDIFIIRKFDFDYDPDAKHDEWLNFINSSISSSDIPVLQEFIGYVFYNGLPAQNFLVLKGPTRAGKGTTLRVLTSLIGKGNFSAVPSSSLFSREDSGHNLASLEGKMVNIDGEVPPRDLLNIANLKKLTGADPIWANEKYKIPHSFLYTGKLILALNSLPKIKLNDSEVDSFFSRILIINYLRSHIEDQNPNLDKSLSEEISGIFNWAMAGLKRLKSNNFRFSSKQNLQERQRLYTLESDPLKVFSDELIIPGECRFKPEELYSIFVKFCNSNHIDPSMNVKNLRSFQLQISGILKARDDLNFIKKSEGHNNVTYYTGFCINTEKNKDNYFEKPLDLHKDNKALDSFNTDSLPEGPVKQSLIEEQAAYTDNKVPNNHATQDNPEIIYRKSQALATDISISDVFQRSGYNYYALDKSKNDIKGKAWQSYIMKSQEITRKEFETMRGDSQ